MKVLLIDDQPAILSALVSGIPWYELGFTGIFTAPGAAVARTILENNYIDIVVSDIEMPLEDGLSLLSWARRQGFDFECILLTAHADFSYAQKAISLQVSEYVTQPAKNEDIVRAVKNAVKNRRERGGSKGIPNITNHINYAAHNIVIKTLFDEWPPLEESIIYPGRLEMRLNGLKQFGIQCEADAHCIVCLLHTRKWKKLPLSSADFLMKYQSLLEQTFSDRPLTSISFCAKEDCFFTIIFSPVTDAIFAGIQSVYTRIPEQIGCTIHLFYAFTEMRFIRNTMDRILDCVHEHKSNYQNEIHPVESNHDELCSLAMGSRNYRHYNRLIREFIQENISEAIGRSDIAEHLQLTPDNVSHIIKTTENMTVKELINHIKMEHARGLLQNTQYAISEISQKCGYDNFAYFSKVYRSTYGITPSQERHLLKPD